MTDERHEAPRRARRSAEADAVDQPAVDDTAADTTRGERFLPEAFSPQTPAPAADADPTPGRASSPSIPEAHAPFMRPGSVPGSASVPPPPPEAVAAHGRRGFSAGADGGVGPAPRRSAASSTTAPDLPGDTPVPGPDFSSPVTPTAIAASQPTAVRPSDVAAGGASAATAATGSATSATDGVDELATRPRRSNPWPMRLLAGVLVLALAAGAFYLVWQRTMKDGQTITVTTSPSTSATPSTPPKVDDQSLMDDQEAGALGGSGWKVVQTLKEVDSSSNFVTCMSVPQGLPNSQATRQRALATSDNSLAALQRIDNYASEDLAKQAYQQRLAKLSACDDIPVLLVNAHQVAGLTDDSFAMTVEEQRKPSVFHTIVLSRTGTVVTMMDASRNNQALGAKQAVEAITPTIKRLCASADGTCPTDITVSDQVVPPTPIQGWLATSDLPRITQGAGIWSAVKPGTVTTRGSQCENLTLASVDGPTAREQRSYILDQDDAAPEGFGVDQVRYQFADEKAAGEFATTLGKSIAECAKRSDTAKISDSKTVTTQGQGGVKVVGQVFLVTQKTSQTESVQFRVGVAQAGNRVTYLVSNTRKNFDFSTDSWASVTARAGQRITQSR
ncbi:hypothetical protein M3G03_11010 [Aestuariimicrobium sp. p3-SID1156]|uniref:hypothetical protein n=1 Tax=Aestuariimicrobium sp. p3-SID1156 TaxID=2916038 RepID=UPI00223AD60E|nr:hypothetical protein [Aestuariimicrobium sp. p3-SID1156]MCT1460057.1 hypothetical protein [Aestuariimicrobium sp. p3-SID1156]